MNALTPKEAQKELDFRELSRRQLTPFSKYIMPNLRHAAFMDAVDKELMEVLRYIETGEGTSRLIIEAPPRHFKSWKVARIFPTFVIGRNPDKEIILTSYSSDLATGHSKMIRQFILSQGFINLWGEKSLSTLDPNDESFTDLWEDKSMPIELDQSSKKKDFFEIDGYGGRICATGVGGMVTGWGGNLIIIDDPYRGRKEAESPTYRDNVLEYYESTLYSRLQKNGAIILIMQRWRKDDLVGVMKDKSNPESDLYIQGADEWKVLKMPAIAQEHDDIGREEGAPLWVEEFDKAALERIRINTGTYSWMSQYQQEPSDPEGAIIKKEWIRKIDAPNEIDHGVQVWDCAVKEGQDNDYWVGMFFVPIPEGLLIRDMIRKKMEAPEGKRTIIEFYNRWNSKVNKSSVTQIRVEDKVSGSPLIQLIKADTKLPIIGYNPKGDKEYRLRAAAPYMESMRVFVPKDAPWLNEFFEEVCSFPYATHDDIVDVLSEGVGYCAGSMGTFRPKRKTEKELTKREKVFRKPKSIRPAIRSYD